MEPKTSRHSLRAWFLGLLFLSGFLVLVTHYSELERFARLVRAAEPVWLLLALLLQAGTYASAAVVWYLPLRSSGVRLSFLTLIPLGIAKLFSDQALPSAGMSGTTFFIAALNRRGIPPHFCMASLLLSTVTFYGAYLLAAVVTLFLLYFYHALHTWIILVASVFALFAVGIPAGALWLRKLGKKELPKILLRIPGLGNLMNALAGAPDELLRRAPLIAVTLLFHGAVFVLDAATLWVMLKVVGQSVTFWVAFPAFILGSMVATIGLIPLGLGTFEAACVSLLGVMGVPLEAALTATLLLRGFTVWLPMLPGMWLVRWALR